MADNPLPEFIFDWPTCQQSAECRGIQIEGFGRCLTHLQHDEQDEFLGKLEPGADLDLSGTRLGGELLDRVVRQFWLAEGHEHEHHFVYGTVSFDRAMFPDGVWFVNAEFRGTVGFYDARFDGATGLRDVWFREGVTFSAARFGTVMAFEAVRAKSVSFSETRFSERVELELDATWVWCERTRFYGGVAMRLSPGRIDASGATFGGSSSIVGAKAFPLSYEVFRISLPIGGELCITSLRDVDVTNLRLTDVNLAECEFVGADGLDQLRITGNCPFGEPPQSWQWTRRQVLVEERRWRDWPHAGWRAQIEPAALAGLYRSLRKSLEDTKNEAEAGDFYYGEMEMRRHSARTRWAERRILDVYWLLSGYGQRAGRALAALLVLITIVAVLLMVWGQPSAEAAQVAIGAVVFRDPGTELTEAGQWTVMVARFLGPVLLALAALAVRARVKR